MDLFYLKDSKEDYYFIEKDSILYQLSNNEIEFIQNEIRYTKNSNQYIGIMTMLFQDSPATLKEVRKTRFDYKPLINLTKDYHNQVCDDYSCIDYSRTTSKKIVFEPNFGLLYTRMIPNFSNDIFIDNSYTLGCNIRIHPLKSYYLWNLNTGINFSQNKFSGVFNSTYTLPHGADYQFSLNYSLMRIPISIDYSFPTLKIQPYISITYNNIFLFTLVRLKLEKHR